LFRAGSPEYAVNPLDKEGKGFVTKADAAVKVKQHLPYIRQEIANYEARKAQKA